ncbi:MAG TPA: Spy/CpxP family protein refolding chaperone [Spirochaetota bacterium]|nr:Spy/CpxP family protein refolding chaperone [Spirochaetota bacterium]
MNNRITVIILSAVIVLLVAFGVIYDRKMRCGFGPFPGYGHRDSMMRGMGPGRNFCTPEFMKERLDLSEEQIVKINVLNEAFDREHDLLMKKIEPEREKLRDLLKQDNPDMKQVRAILEKIGAVNIDVHMLRINQGRVISTILNSEQKEKLERERRMFRGKGPGPGPEGME